MCIIFIAKNVHPDTPLVIAANRDEFFARPTQSPHWWEDAPHMFAGKDLQAGGTWLGYNKQNRIAGITNLRRLDWYKSDAKSRGELVKGFLDIDTGDTDVAIADYTAFLESNYAQYNPFNLLFGDSKHLVIFSSATGRAQEVPDGIHSLSNGAPDDVWPKMQRGIDRYLSCVKGYQTPNIEEILNVLRDDDLANKEDIPDTGLSYEEESQLSSIFVPEFKLRGKPYGTRSSSVINVMSEKEAITIHMTTKRYDER